MVERFGKMSVNNADLFVIKRLDMPKMKVESPSPLIRSEIHCFFFIMRGEALIAIGDESYFFKANECAVIPSGQMFSVRYYDDCAGFMGGFHSDFLNTDNEGKNLLHTFGFLRKWGEHKVIFDEQQGKHITTLFERLNIENDSGKNKNIIKAYLTTLLVEIDEVYQRSETANDDFLSSNRICNRFIESVFKQCDHRIPIVAYAEKLNITPAHLHKTIKRFTGKTPLTWINEAVILEAKVLLAHTDSPVNEIAGKVGIHDSSYFARLFKKQVGVSPVDYRNESKYPQKG